VSNIVLGYGSSELWRLTRLSHLLREGDGSIMSLDDATGATVRRLGHIYIHPTYDENMEHDIALVKVMEPIVWSAKVIPACLPPAEPSLDHVGHGRVHLPKQYCKLAGWGSEADGGDYVGHLASIEIPVMTDQKCAHTSASIFGRRVDTWSTLCAGHFDGTRQSPCKGDDGGGLTCQWNGNYYLVGVAGQQIGECSVL
uniref:Peptidase S1 domain-containing protein n=1 Tax=Ciona savignyi TaxID=51511 RepID=H2ZKI0_CIOSA